MNKNCLIIFLILFFFVCHVYSQEEANAEESVQEVILANEIPPEEIAVETVYEENDIFIIVDFDFDIKGRTLPNALIFNAKLKKGEIIKGITALDKYIQDKTQDLINQRGLRDIVEVVYSIGEKNTEGYYQTILKIRTEDTLNFIAVPYPKYSTNSGFDLSIRARDGNFLGRMEPLRIDLGYKYDENYRHSFNILVDTNIPFWAAGLKWNVRFSNLFVYRPHVDSPFSYEGKRFYEEWESVYYQNITGLSMELPWRRTIFIFGIEESSNYNEENSSRHKINYDYFQHGLYMSTRLYTSWEIPTGLKIKMPKGYEKSPVKQPGNDEKTPADTSRFAELTYKPNLFAVFNHELKEEWELHDFRKGPFIGLNHSLYFENIDWKGNFRNGLNVSLNNSLSYDFYRAGEGKDPLSASYSVRGTAHFKIRDFFGISTRLFFRQWFYHDPEYHDQAGDVLRGIADREIKAKYMLSLNMDFPFRLFVFAPSKWLKNHKLRFFDFEFHASPVIDLALYNEPQIGDKEEVSFNFKNIAATGGLELIVFPAAFRRYYIRFCFAVNLRDMFTTGKLPSGGNREISIGIGHFY